MPDDEDDADDDVDDEAKLVGDAKIWLKFKEKITHSYAKRRPKKKGYRRQQADKKTIIHTNL